MNTPQNSEETPKTIPRGHRTVSPNDDSAGVTYSAMENLRVLQLSAETLREVPRDRTPRKISQPNKSFTKGTAVVGYENRHGQVVVRRTDQPGVDRFQRVYVLQCKHCRGEYGVDGTEIHRKLCPFVHCPSGQRGKPGIPVDDSDIRTRSMRQGTPSQINVESIAP